MRVSIIQDLSGNPTGLARTLEEAAQTRLADLAREERAWVDRIEETRDRLLADDSEIAIMNYGAGNPRSQRTREEMDSGWVTYDTVSNVCRRASSKQRKALLLFSLVRGFRPQRCIELGTCLGVSTAYLAAGLELNGRGHITTLEGSPSFAQIADRELRRLQLDNVSVRVGRFHETLRPVLDQGLVDFGFIDGHHDEHATLDYFVQILGHAANQALLLFDDITWSPGMARAWREISNHPRVTVAADMGEYGAAFVTGS